jgi:hypothetical protein
MRTLKYFLLILTLAAFSVRALNAETIKMRNGSTIQGSILNRSEGSLQVVTPEGREMSLNRTDIASVEMDKYTVLLKSGEDFTGTISDMGENYIQLDTSAGEKKFFNQDIEMVSLESEFKRMQELKKAEELRKQQEALLQQQQQENPNAQTQQPQAQQQVNSATKTPTMSVSAPLTASAPATAVATQSTQQMPTSGPIIQTVTNPVSSSAPQPNSAVYNQQLASGAQTQVAHGSFGSFGKISRGGKVMVEPERMPGSNQTQPDQAPLQQQNIRAAQTQSPPATVQQQPMPVRNTEKLASAAKPQETKTKEEPIPAADKTEDEKPREKTGNEKNFSIHFGAWSPNYKIDLTNEGGASGTKLSSIALSFGGQFLFAEYSGFKFGGDVTVFVLPSKTNNFTSAEIKTSGTILSARAIAKKEFSVPGKIKPYFIAGAGLSYMKVNYNVKGTATNSEIQGHTTSSSQPIFNFGLGLEKKFKEAYVSLEGNYVYLKPSGKLSGSSMAGIALKATWKFK